MERRAKTRILSKETLRSYRLTQGIKASHFAEQVGISRAHLSGIESGRHGVSEKIAIRMLQILRERDPNITFDDVFAIERPNEREHQELFAR